MKNPNTLIVSKVVWPWRQEKITLKKSGAWKRALILSILVSIFATLLFYLDHILEAALIWTIAFLLFISSIILPKVHAKFECLAQRFGRIVAYTLTWILLTLTYYFIFWPCTLFFKRRKSNNFSHEFPGATESYWVSRTRSTPIDQYKRQFK